MSLRPYSGLSYRHSTTSGTQTEELAGSHLATSAQPPRTTSLFSLYVSSQHAPQPMRFIMPLETPGALLEGLHCLTASRPLPTPNEFQGKTMPRLLLITDSRLSENDRQNVFLEELTVGPQLYPRSSAGTWSGLGAIFFLCFARRGMGLGCGAVSARTIGAGQTPSTGQSKGRQGDHKRSTKINVNTKNVFRNAGCVSHLWSM